jgi:hypothetical protein
LEHTCKSPVEVEVLSTLAKMTVKKRTSSGGQSVMVKAPLLHVYKENPVSGQHTVL